MLTLLQLAIALIVACQNPNIPAELRTQGLTLARQALESIKITPQEINLPPATSTPQTSPLNQPIQPAPMPNPEPQDPSNVLGSQTFAASFSINVTTTTVQNGGGEILFNIEGKDPDPKTGEVLIDELETNLRPGQKFYKIPPIPGTSSSYRMGITATPTSSYLKVTIGGETVEAPVTL
jgi:hypothetical protein